jgi:predicted DNA-binding transcriptional regulator YafY
MQVLRVLSILNHLSVGPETVPSLHHKLQGEGHKVSQRTIYRDLLKLEEAFKLGNIKLRRYTGEFNKATWIIATADPKTYVRDDLYLQTFMTEHFKPEWLKAFTGSSIEDVFTNGNTITESEALVIQKNISQFSIQHSNWGEFIYNHEHYNRLKDIIWAISNQRIIYIAYFDHNGHVEHKFRPLKVVYHRGTIHLVGWLIVGDEVFIQAQELDCIRTTRITNERYQQTNEEAVVRQALIDRFGIHDSVQKDRVQVVLEMGEGPAIFLMNRHWHPTQSFRKTGDNRWRMEFSCMINIELVGWVFSWLEHVKVLEPASLRDLMAERAAYIADMYRKNLPPVAPGNTDEPYAIGR